MITSVFVLFARFTIVIESTAEIRYVHGKKSGSTAQIQTQHPLDARLNRGGLESY